MGLSTAAVITNCSINLAAAEAFERLVTGNVQKEKATDQHLLYRAFQNTLLIISLKRIILKLTSVCCFP